MSDWEHDALAADLASYLSGPDLMVWTDMQLGPSGSPRPDVYTLRKSYSRPSPLAFEVKVSRSDLRSDTTSGKWQSYLQYAAAVTFAVPDGLCTVADIPDGCGLIVRKEQVWRYARRPTLQKVTPPFSACMKLLIDGVSRTYRPAAPQPRSVALWAEHEAIREKFGQAVAIAARDLAGAEKRCADLKQLEAYEREEAKRRTEAYKEDLRRQAEADAGEWIAIRDEIKEWLGMEGAGTGIWGVRQRLKKLRDECDADARVAASAAQVDAVKRSLEQLLRSLPADKQRAA